VGGVNANVQAGKNMPNAIGPDIKQSAWQYPQGVDCVKWLPKPTCATDVVTTTVTETAAAPPETTESTTVTETSTEFPSATTTVTEVSSTTETLTEFTEVVETNTVIETATSLTTLVYAACATENAADRVGGTPISNLYHTGGGGNTVTSLGRMDNAYQCCVAALLITTGVNPGVSDSERLTFHFSTLVMVC
jgi:hypothetical protein